MCGSSALPTSTLYPLHVFCIKRERERVRKKERERERERERSVNIIHEHIIKVIAYYNLSVHHTPCAFHGILNVRKARQASSLIYVKMQGFSSCNAGLFRFAMQAFLPL